MIAFFGAGLLGSGFVRAYRRRNEEVHVWNRTHAKAKALEASGARAFEDPAEAVRGVDRLHLTLSDDAAVDEVLGRAKAGFGKGLVVVDHTTTSPTGTKARAERFAREGIAFLHAPVFMGPQNALESTGVMLTSGDAARVESLRSTLEAMTGKLVYLGPEAERAASMKLLGNLFLMFVTSGIAEVFNLGKALDVKPEEAARIFDIFNPTTMVPPRLKRILQQEFATPSWELAMARKDARLMLEEGERHDVPLAILPAIAATMDRYIARGHGNDDWTVIAKDGVTPRS